MNLINQEDLNKALHNLRTNAVANAEQFQNAGEVLGTILSVEYIAHYLPVYAIDDTLASALFQPEDEDDEQDDNLLLKMSEPIQKWLRQNKNPYVKVVISADGTEVISTDQWIPSKD